MALNSKQQMKPYHKNPRRINKKQFEQLKENLLYLGDLSGIVHDLNSNEIIGGNQRSSVFDVSKCDIEIVHQYDYPDEQGTIAHGFIIWKDKRYTYRQVRWTPKQCEQANITANRLGGEWDFDELANWDMSDLLTWGFEESDFPFDVAPATNEGADAEPQTDKAEELRQKWNVQSGQMWQLGEHRIVCGDCTDRAVVERVMGGEKWNCIVTDPPYGVDYEGGRNPDSNKPREKLHGDGDALLYADFLNLWMDYRQDKSVVYMWFADKRGISVFNAVESVGLTVRAMIIWNKVDAHYGNFMAQYMQKHEPCLYCVKDSSEWYGATNEVTVWDIKQPTINEFHPTQKPIECMAKPITNSTKIGDIVAEPFSGSGTTLIACENLSRKCRAVEISPAYVAVAIQRWVDVTGKKPILLDA